MAPPKAQVFLNSKESNSRLDTSVGTVVDDEHEKIGQKGELDGGNSHICYFHPKPWGKWSNWTNIFFKWVEIIN